MVRIEDPVVTARLLETRLGEDDRKVEISPGSKLTPSARDLLRAREIEIVPPSPDPGPGGPPADPSGGTERSRRFSGIFTANIVIYDEQGRISYGEMERYIAWLIEAGIHGLYPNGSTGEFVRLSSEERRDVVRLIAEVNQGRVPILAGASEANIRDVLRMAGYYADLGADAISLVPPYYYKISDTSLYEYFAEIARHSPLDILLYNIPQFTQELPLDTMERLLAFECIFGTKDSSRDLPRIVNTIDRLRRHRPDYVVLNGCEEILLPAIVMGANGGTTATSGIVPEVIVELYDRAVAGDLERARELQYRLLPLINLMLLGVNFPEGFRTGVAVRGFDAGPPRTVLSAEERDYLLRLESEIGCVLGDMGYSVRGARGCPVTHLPPIVAGRRPAAGG